MECDLGDLAALEIGTGQVKTGAEQASLSISPNPGRYANAQLDDYGGMPRHSFPWKPPAHMRVRARAEPGSPAGTLGFGFWNDPFSLALGQPGAPFRLPTSPQAVWFFYSSPESSLGLVEGAMPYGWKAMSLVTRRVPGLLLAPSALAALALSRVPGVRRPVVSLALGQVSAAEAILDAELEDWRTYEISWGIEQVAFRVDGRDVFQADLAPNGPLGFVTWIDNQYAIVSPQEGIRFGVEELRANQRLELTDLSVSNSESITQA